MSLNDCINLALAAGREEENGNHEAANLLYRQASNCLRTHLAMSEKVRHPPEKLIVEKMTDDLRARVYEDPGVAIEVSKGLEMAFQKAGIKFDKGKTFAAVLYVIEQPENLSQVVYVDDNARTRIAYLTNPQTIEFAIKRIQQDRINIHK